jgi:hypothetical protein
MYPIKASALESEYPNTYRYLSSMRDVLKSRNGFAGWEKNIHKEYFYTLQRIGPYTFSPYKVCWSYISNDFTIAVIGPDARHRPVFPNDKVVFIPFAGPDEAFFAAGILSSAPIRMGVVSSASSRQISANVIQHFAVPEYDASHPLHVRIAEACRDGHRAMTDNNIELAIDCYEEINEAVASLYHLSDADLEEFRAGLLAKLGFYPFKARRDAAFDDD